MKIKLFIGTSFLFNSANHFGNKPDSAAARGASDCKINQPEIEPKQARILRAEAIEPANSELNIYFTASANGALEFLSTSCGIIPAITVLLAT